MASTLDKELRDLLTVFAKGRASKLKFHLRVSPKGKKFVDIREWVQRADGTEQRTMRGFSIPLDRFEEFIQTTIAAAGMAEEL